MSRTYALLTSILFALVGLVHLLRVVFGWHFVIGSWNVPAWLSVVAVVVLGVLSAVGCRVASGCQKVGG